MYMNKALELPGLSKEENKNLTELIENFFTKAPFEETTNTLANSLSKQIAQYFVNKEITLPAELYDQAYDLTTNAITSNDLYYQSIINFAIKNAIQAVYLAPTMRFFEHTSQINQPHQSLHELTMQLFAMSKMQKSLEEFNDDDIYIFIKNNFFKLSNETMRGTLNLVDFSEYRHRLNRLPTAKKDTRQFINLFNIFLNRMQKEIYSEFKNSLAINNDDYTSFIVSLNNKLYFDDSSKRICKNVFFNYLFSNLNHLFKKNPVEQTHREQLATNVQFYLAAIEDQLVRWKEHPKDITRLKRLLNISKNAHDVEIALRCFGEIVAIANTESKPNHFFNRRTQRQIDTEFYDVIKRFYKICDEFNLIPQVQKQDCLRFSF